jgi:hypothetical protein
MAGADRYAVNTSAADITDYRVDPANQTTNGLDSRFGAGQVNIYNSFLILGAREQNSSEDIGAGNIGIEGFDYDPSFGGLGGSNATASYYFSTGANQAVLSTTLAWNININGGNGSSFSGSAELNDLDLNLYDTSGSPVLLESSTSAIDNTENIWVVLPAGRDYLLQVVSKSGQGTFDWDYALAWRMLIDTDGDGVPDDQDNCINAANGLLIPDAGGKVQLDTDFDGYGNACDGDLDNSGGIVNFGDLAAFKTAFGTTDPRADFNGTGGVVNFGDLAIFKQLFGLSPGFSVHPP